MRIVIQLGLATLIAIKLAALATAQSSALPAEQVKFFEAKIRPVLVQHCYGCHSADSREIGGNLQVDGRDGLLKGGDSGPAIVPGKPAASLLLTAIKHTDRNMIMPPKDAGAKLPANTIADFEKWIAAGAIDPRSVTPKASAKKKYDPEAAKNWWAWQPRRNPVPPTVKNEAWVRDPIDRFVLAQLEREGLEPNRDADRTTLVRRIAFDLTGLPPTVPELYDFALSPTPKPIEQLVDRYLDSSTYGERMARRWLDVARYAESAGKDMNANFPNAWRYRDYVIDSFNSDLSFKDFIVEQLAGDLLPSRSPEQKAIRTIATGFLAIGPKGLNDMNARQFACDIADEQIDTLSQAFLGITIACARCHDHKFDPISQKDYTAMAGIFLSTETHFGTQGGVGGRNRSSLIELPDSFADSKSTTRRDPGELKQLKERLATLREQQQEMIAERIKERAAGGDGSPPGPEFLRVQTQVVNIETELAQYNDNGTMKALAMGVQDKPRSSQGGGMLAQRLRGGLGGGPGGGPGNRPGMGARPGLPGGGLPGGFPAGFRPQQRPGALPPEMMFINDSPLLERGDVDKPTERVPRGLPVFFAKDKQKLLPPSESGRMEVARWIASDMNPLTGRVIANRIWGWTMGRALVASVDNFGSTGDQPTHPELLDYLASEFIVHNWSVKQLVRRIVLSHVYAMSSDTNEANFLRDPDNHLLWRANSRMLEAEAVRDTMLVAAGLLELERPHGSVISKYGDGIIGGRPNGQRNNGLSEDQITKAGGSYRSLYLPIPRNVLPDSMELFDFPDNSMLHGTRETTLVPGQALFWMNSQAVERSAAQMAMRVIPALAADQPKQASSSNTSRQGRTTVEPRSTAGNSEPRSQGWSTETKPIDVSNRLDDVFLLTLSRLPHEDERVAAVEFVSSQQKAGASDLAIWTSLCRSVMSSADFRKLR